MATEAEMKSLDQDLWLPGREAAVEAPLCISALLRHRAARQYVATV